ncbi:MAG: hypothetical protein IPK82_25465 [Polyangiaceae bacterium]|nr:hypothetical protein [Polyangiaceae bacterium]
MSTRRSIQPLFGAFVMLSACSSKITPAPDRTGPPLLTPVEVTVDGKKLDNTFQIEGALMVTQGARVGRWTNGKVEWVGETPLIEDRSVGYVHKVSGKWPDAVDALYSNPSGRWNRSSYVAVTGKRNPPTEKGKALVSGGATDHIAAIVKLGNSTFVVERGFMGRFIEFTVIDGPAIPHKPKLAKDEGCERQSNPRFKGPPDEFVNLEVAVLPLAIESTRNGYLVSIGQHCKTEKWTAEVWDPNGKSMLLDLPIVYSRDAPHSDGTPALFRGKGNDLWFLAHPTAPILHFENGAFERVEGVTKPFITAFASPDGTLHASDGQTIHRYDQARWENAAHLPWTEDDGSMTYYDGSFWIDGKELRPNGGLEPRPDCSTPYVHIADGDNVDEMAAKTTAAKTALSTFPDGSSITLVRYQKAFHHFLGAAVRSTKQAESLAKHLQTSLGSDFPRPLCFEPPTGSITIHL